MNWPTSKFQPELSIRELIVEQKCQVAVIIASLLKHDDLEKGANWDNTVTPGTVSPSKGQGDLKAETGFEPGLAGAQNFS